MRGFCFLIFLVVFQVNAQKDTIIDGDTISYWIEYGGGFPDSKYCDTCIYEEGPTKNHLKHGEWTRYYPNGQVKLIGVYVDNRPNGRYTKYHENGVLKETGTFSWQYHERIGENIRYSPNGCITYIGHFNDQGKEEGVQTYYFDNCDSVGGAGQIEFQYKAKNGVPVKDTVYRYYRNGDVKERIYYSDDGSVKARKMFDRKRPAEGTKED